MLYAGWKHNVGGSSVHPNVNTFLAGTLLENFLKFDTNIPLGLKDELIRFWWSNIAVTSQNTFFGQHSTNNDSYNKTLHKCQKNVLAISQQCISGTVTCLVMSVYVVQLTAAAKYLFKKIKLKKKKPSLLFLN